MKALRMPMRPLRHISNTLAWRAQRRLQGRKDRGPISGRSASVTSKGESAKGESAQVGERAQGESAQGRECQGRECPSPGLQGAGWEKMMKVDELTTTTVTKCERAWSPKAASGGVMGMIQQIINDAKAMKFPRMRLTLLRDINTSSSIVL